MATTKEPITGPPEQEPGAREAAPATTDGERRHRHSPLYWIVFAAAVLLTAVLVIVFVWLPRQREEREVAGQAKAREEARPRVRVIRVEPGPAQGTLNVPGTTQALSEASIYARASGYLKRRLVDIGDRVRSGQLMAEIDAPDLDRQVDQARSNLRQSESSLRQTEAQLHLAAVTWDRWKVLVAKGVFSRQDGDTQEANFRVAEANVRAAESTVQGNRENLGRLIVLQEYERVRAPFDGVVTARNVDVGTLITAQGSGASSVSATLPGTTQSAAQANNGGASGLSSNVMPSTGGSQGGVLFNVAATNILRVLVSVPEVYSGTVHTGQEAALMFQQLPGRQFNGRVTRSAASIDQNTRTLLVELQLRNERNVLLPGMYTQVSLQQATAFRPILVPGEAIVVRGGKSMVAQVDGRTVHMRPVTIGRDYGEEAEVMSGLHNGDVIAVNVSDDVNDGAEIDPEMQPNKLGGGKSQTGGQPPQPQAQYGDQKLSNGSEGASKKSGGAQHK